MEIHVVNLLDFDAEALTDWFVQQGEKPFRAKQVLRWVHRFGVTDFEQMTDVAKSLRAKLAGTACITPPVPVRWRRRMLSLGSGDPTRAICSTLIAQAFQSVRYPILPLIENVPSIDPMCPGCMDEILHVRHHSLFAPRDFDVSPYFAVIKPTIASGFNHRALAWHDDTRVPAA